MSTRAKPSVSTSKTVATKSAIAIKKPAVKSPRTKTTTSSATKVTGKSTVAKPTTTAIVTPTETAAITTKTSASVAVNKTSKVLKPKKIKLVRDSFTIPKPEYLVLDDLKLRALELKHPVKKGELLRAGIKALAAMTDSQLLAALQAVPALKTGRPGK